MSSAWENQRPSAGWTPRAWSVPIGDGQGPDLLGLADAGDAGPAALTKARNPENSGFPRDR